MQEGVHSFPEGRGIICCLVQTNKTTYLCWILPKSFMGRDCQSLLVLYTPVISYLICLSQWLRVQVPDISEKRRNAENSAIGVGEEEMQAGKQRQGVVG